MFRAAWLRLPCCLSERDFLLLKCHWTVRECMKTGGAFGHCVQGPLGLFVCLFALSSQGTAALSEVLTRVCMGTDGIVNLTSAKRGQIQGASV